MSFHLICIETACGKQELLSPFYQEESKSFMQLKAMCNVGGYWAHYNYT